MPTTLRNFAATLAAVGLLSFGSMTMGQQDAEQPPSDPTSIENVDQPSDVAESQATDEIEAARPDTPPDDPNSPAENSDIENSDIDNSDIDNSDIEADAAVDADVATDDASATAEADAESRESDAAASDRANSEEDNNAANSRDADNTSNDRGDDSNRGDGDRDATDDDKQLSPPEVPEQARDRDANAREDVNADWRMIDRDGLVWFYSPSGQWHIRQGNTWHAYHDGMHHRDLNDGYGNRGYNTYDDRSVVRYEGRMGNDAGVRYSTGYRGEADYQSGHGEHHAQHVRYDRCGRAYVCVNGCAVYVQEGDVSHNVQHSDSQQPTMADEQYQDVPPPPAVEDRDDQADERSAIPSPPAPPSGA